MTKRRARDRLLEARGRFESKVAEARHAGDANEEAKWQEAIDAADALMAKNKAKAERARAGRDMVEAARYARRHIRKRRER